MNGAEYLESVLREFRKMRKDGDAAIAQVSDEEIFRSPQPESNSIAVLMKHISGNMRSRWTDFLTSDGEKADRDRDAEFELAGADSRERLLASWRSGWDLLFSAIGALKAEDLDRPVVIRGETMSAVQAIQRQLTHYAGHVGQIVYAAKGFAGSRWKTLSIPKGQSKTFNASPTPYVERKSG